MPVDKSLSKVQKKIKGKEKALHPRGLKFKQVARATLRREKLGKNKTERTNIKESHCMYK
jgi:hypothetical protein